MLGIITIVIVGTALCIKIIISIMCGILITWGSSIMSLFVSLNKDDLAWNKNIYVGKNRHSSKQLYKNEQYEICYKNNKSSMSETCVL